MVVGVGGVFSLELRGGIHVEGKKRERDEGGG